MWLETQKIKLLKYWIEQTSAPMLVSSSDGQILWVNEAFEELLGWSRPEICGKMTWMDITANDVELEADLEMVSEMVIGNRTSYQLQKMYKTKNGPPKRVLIDVVRYPQAGLLEFCLVTVMPIEANLEYIVGQITTIQQLLSQSKTGSKYNISYVLELIEKYPKAVTLLLLIIAVVFFGDQVLDVMKAIGSIL